MKLFNIKNKSIYFCNTFTDNDNYKKHFLNKTKTLK